MSTTDGTAIFQKFENDYVVAQVQGGIRFASGLQICWGTNNFDMSFEDIRVGEFYRYDINSKITYSLPFNENPIVAIKTGDAGDYPFSIVYSSYSDKTGLTKVVCVRPITGSGSVPITYIAIGTWK